MQRHHDVCSLFCRTEILLPYFKFDDKVLNNCILRPRLKHNFKSTTILSVIVPKY